MQHDAWLVPFDPHYLYDVMTNVHKRTFTVMVLFKYKGNLN